MTDAEEKALIAEFIEHDKSLTDSERADKRTQEREAMYVDQLHRQIEHMSTHLPSFLLALQAHNNYRVACSLWPDDMARVLHDEFIDDVMRRSERCRSCRKDFPLPYDDREYCDACLKEVEAIEADGVNTP
jgi:hypothetical protein